MYTRRSLVAPQGSELRGKALASYALAQARDGYQVVFSLGEVDPAFIDNEILLADTASGKPAARSVRMLTKLEVVQLRK